MSERTDRIVAALTSEWKPTSRIIAEAGTPRDTDDAMRNTLSKLARRGIADHYSRREHGMHVAYWKLAGGEPWKEPVPPTGIEVMRGRLTDFWQTTAELVGEGGGSYKDLYKLARSGEAEHWRDGHIAYWRRPQ